MKPQDVVFFVILLLLLFFRKSNWFVLAGLLCLLIAIPLFARYIFFTAEHVTYYATAFFLIAVVCKTIEMKKTHENRH